jgi:prepilin-type N-terminal cleavage/methylation domain-containing protein
MPQRKFQIKCRGFSLVELLLSLAIIGLVVVVALPNLRGFSKTQEVDAAAAKLVDVLENAQSSASSHISCPDGIVSSNWNVVLNSGSFVLNCLSSATSSVNQPALTSAYKSDPNSATTFTMSSNVCVPATTPIAFTFTNQQLAYQCTGASGNWPVRVTLTNGTSSRVIVIEQGGVIRVE